MKKSDLRSNIMKNKRVINAMLKNQPMRKRGFWGWTKHEIYNENEALIPRSPEARRLKMFASINYTYMENQRNVVEYISRNHKPIGRFEVYDIHSRLCENTDTPGGALRTADCDLGALNIFPPSAQKILYKMENVYYYLQDAKLDPISKALQAHYDIIALQPFCDYNKRTARMIMNWVLLQNGFTPIIFNCQNDRKFYMATLRLFADNPSAYEYCMLGSMRRTQEQIMRVLTTAQTGR
ncbi:MAG: Fic family protein [Rickettsiales bacterium]|jgi:Fic family protein|nr:Fic family protein [Rickettsiales bacterium]